MPTSFYIGLKALLGGALSGASLLDNTPQHDLVKKHLDGFDKFRVPVYVVATDYISKRMKILGPGTPAVDMALATSAVPVAFPAYNGLYMDGGCVMNCPYPYLIDSCGASKIVVLYCDPDPENSIGVTAPIPTSINTGTAAIASMFQVQSDRAFDELEKVAELRKLKGKSDVEIAHFFPSGPTGELLQFGGNIEQLQKGYDSAVKYLTPDKVKALLVP
jgi:predicted acylesterase/phospholipase RssA